MRNLIKRKQGENLIITNSFLIIVLALIITSCAGSGKPQYEVESYLIGYPAPSMDKREKLDASLKFNRFSIASAYNSINMVFRKDAYSLDVFNYSKWAVNPTDMIADSLLRDIRETGLFRAVFSRYETDEGQFVISGSIEEFFLRVGKNDKTAIITIAVLMKNEQERETNKNIMFQKKYTREEPLQESSPEGYSKAASQAMRVISQQIINDVHSAIKSNSKSTANSP